MPDPNIGDRLRAVARLAAESPAAQASPCPVTCWRCGADCVWREHYYREPLAVGAMLCSWREACCSRCSWTDRPLDAYEGDPHPEG